MAGLRSLYRHWQVGHYEVQRRREEQQQFEFQTILGAYGFNVHPQAEPSNLNESLLVAWLAATDPPEPS